MFKTRLETRTNSMGFICTQIIASKIFATCILYVSFFFFFLFAFLGGSIIDESNWQWTNSIESRVQWGWAFQEVDGFAWDNLNNHNSVDIGNFWHVVQHFSFLEYYKEPRKEKRKKQIKASAIYLDDVLSLWD